MDSYIPLPGWKKKRMSGRGVFCVIDFFMQEGGKKGGIGDDEKGELCFLLFSSYIKSRGQTTTTYYSFPERESRKKKKIKKRKKGKAHPSIKTLLSASKKEEKNKKRSA